MADLFLLDFGEGKFRWQSYHCRKSVLFAPIADVYAERLRATVAIIRFERRRRRPKLVKLR
ncbi:hypothetical protein LguiB_001907 [Lonicera macranthoides]